MEDKTEVSITLHSSNTFVFKFLNTDDRNLALDYGAFYIGSNLFVVRPWSPLIENSIAEMKSIPVWILIYNVPLHLWNNLGLSPIASFVGKPLIMDDCTINRTPQGFLLKSSLIVSTPTLSLCGLMENL